MRHGWESSGLCLYCRRWCPYCNDCTCPGNGWTRYAASACPGFDTQAGALRPHREHGLRRLTEQLPGWGVWYSGPPVAGWYAVPAPPEASLGEKLALPNRIGPYRTPQALRTDARARYGWDDTCDTCDMLARTCGHRQPEQEKVHP